jgi:hypothetical protein
VRKRLPNLLTGLSLLLFLAVAVLWARSGWWVDSVVWTRNVGPGETRRTFVAFGRGALWFGRERWVHPATPAGAPEPAVAWRHTPDPRDGVRPVVPPGDVGAKAVFAGYDVPWFTYLQVDSFDVMVPPASRDRSYMAVPAWIPLAAAAALPAAWLLGRSYGALRRRLRRPGTCPACGYDLTGNVSGVCPECGRGAT